MNNSYGSCTKCGTIFGYSILDPVLKCPSCSNFQPNNLHGSLLTNISSVIPSPTSISTSGSIPPTSTPNSLFHQCPSCLYIFVSSSQLLMIQCPQCQTSFESVSQTLLSTTSSLLHSTITPDRSLLLTEVQLPDHPTSLLQKLQPSFSHQLDPAMVSSIDPSDTIGIGSTHSNEQNPVVTWSNPLQLISNMDHLSLPNKEYKAPKRASNAYMIFCKKNRRKVKADNPELPFGRLGQKLGEMWRSLSTEEKKPYENVACSDRERYKGEMNAYQSASVFSSFKRNHGIFPAVLSISNTSTTDTSSSAPYHSPNLLQSGPSYFQSLLPIIPQSPFPITLNLNQFVAPSTPQRLAPLFEDSSNLLYPPIQSLTAPASLSSALLSPYILTSANSTPYTKLSSPNLLNLSTPMRPS